MSLLKIKVYEKIILCLPSDMKWFSLPEKYVYDFLGCLYFDFSHSSNYSSLLIFLLSFLPAHFAYKNKTTLTPGVLEEIKRHPQKTKTTVKKFSFTVFQSSQYRDLLWFPPSCGTIKYSGGLHWQEIQTNAALFCYSHWSNLKSAIYLLKLSRSRKYQTTKCFKKHLNHCSEEGGLTFSAPVMKREITGFCFVFWDLVVLSSLNLQHSLFFAIEVTLQGQLSSLKFSFSYYYIIVCTERT